MNKDATNRYLVLNMQSHAVELHFNDQVVVIPSMGQVELTEDELATAQVQVLLRRRFITAHKMEDESSDEAETAVSGDDSSSETSSDTGGEPSRHKGKRKRSDH